MTEDTSSFYDQIDELARAHSRFRRESYFFIYSALDHTVRDLRRDRKEEASGRHVTGQELCLGIAEYGRTQFGPLVRSVFHHWGIRTTADFGEIVFTLVDHGLMSKTEEDRDEDFADIYKFDDVFDPRKIQSDSLDLDLEAF